MLLPKRTRLMCQSSRLLLCPPIMALRHLLLHQHTVPPFCPNKQKLSRHPGVTVWAESAGSGQNLRGLGRCCRLLSSWGLTEGKQPGWSCSELTPADLPPCCSLLARTLARSVPALSSSGFSQLLLPHHRHWENMLEKFPLPVLALSVVGAGRIPTVVGQGNPLGIPEPASLPPSLGRSPVLPAGICPAAQPGQLRNSSEPAVLPRMLGPHVASPRGLFSVRLLMWVTTSCCQ